MKKVILLILLLAVVWTESAPKCSVCLKIAKCPKELLDDSYVDPIYNFIAKQV